MKETTLYRAFALPRFVPNPRLQAVIDRSHARLAARELSDDELDFVAAAGQRLDDVEYVGKTTAF